MEKHDFVVVGAGVSGLAFANAVRAAGKTALVLERDSEPGGFCRTVKQDGFVWDYSGHFFHFRHRAIAQWMQERMPPGSVRAIEKRSRVVDVDGNEVGFPFQTHIHELPRDAFAACLADLKRANDDAGTAPAASFRDMLARRFGDAICARFLTPYNAKLYATDLNTLDVDAMGRFFPHTTLDDTLAAIAGRGTSASYNETFTYPSGGAVEYIHALLRDLPPESVVVGESVVAVDVDARVITTSKPRRIGYEHLVTSAPLPQVLRACAVAHDAGAFTSNQVLVLNLGFDRKGRDDVHWMYFADPALSFYRVGFYDNILGTDRMSLYVEVGMPAGAAVDVGIARARALADLQRVGIMRDEQRLVSWHHVVMNPAYVHITRRSIAEAQRTRAFLADVGGVHAIGRYGGWTYCSIEDNVVEARALAAALTS